jgi:hypothetical protein
VKGRLVVPMVGLSFSTDRKPLVRLAFFEAQAVVALQIAIGLVYARADSSFVANTSVALKGLRWCDGGSETWADGG